MTNSQNTDFGKVGRPENLSETFMYDGKIKLQHPEKLKPILAWAQVVVRYFDKIFSLQPPRDAVTIMSIFRLSLKHAACCNNFANTCAFFIKFCAFKMILVMDLQEGLLLFRRITGHFYNTSMLATVVK